MKLVVRLLAGGGGVSLVLSVDEGIEDGVYDDSEDRDSDDCDEGVFDE